MPAARSGCQRLFRPLTDVSYVVDGDRGQNPDELGRPLPTIVRIYQLKSVSRLELSTFETLWRTPTVALGDQLLSVEEMTVYPATRVARTVARVPEARFVVAVAIVRQPAGAVWRAVVPLATPQQEAACASLREADSRLGFRLEGWRIEESAAALLPPDEEGIAADPAARAMPHGGAMSARQNHSPRGRRETRRESPATSGLVGGDVPRAAAHAAGRQVP